MKTSVVKSLQQQVALKPRPILDAKAKNIVFKLKIFWACYLWAQHVVASRTDERLLYHVVRPVPVLILLPNLLSLIKQLNWNKEPNAVLLQPSDKNFGFNTIERQLLPTNSEPATLTSSTRNETEKKLKFAINCIVNQGSSYIAEKPSARIKKVSSLVR